MQACNRQSAYCVPLYDTLGSDAVRYIINHAEVTVVFADSLKMPALIQPLAETKGQVSAVVYWGECDTLAKVVSNRPEHWPWIWSACMSFLYRRVVRACTACKIM